MVLTKQLKNKLKYLGLICCADILCLTNNVVYFYIKIVLYFNPYILVLLYTYLCLYLVLHYPDVYQPCKPVILQQTRVPNSLPMGINYVDYEPQGTEVIQACLQTTPYKRWPQWFSTTPE